MRLKAVLGREFFGNFVHAGQAEIPGLFKIFAKLREFRARSPHPEREYKGHPCESLPLRCQVVDLGHLAVISQGRIANHQRRVRALQHLIGVGSQRNGVHCAPVEPPQKNIEERHRGP